MIVDLGSRASGAGILIFIRFHFFFSSYLIGTLRLYDEKMKCNLHTCKHIINNCRLTLYGMGMEEEEPPSKRIVR